MREREGSYVRTTEASTHKAGTGKAERAWCYSSRRLRSRELFVQSLDDAEQGTHAGSYVISKKHQLRDSG